MKVYAFGEETAPVILLLPGTCCHWKGNFGHVIPLLSDEYRVLCVSYDGFDETERTEFPTMLEETAKIEDYLKANCVGHIRAAYGCSLGGSFVGLLAARGNIRMDYGILGSSDLDQSSKFAAKLQTNLLLSLMFPMLRDGRFKSPLLQKRVEKQMRQMGDYGVAFLRILGGARPYLTQQSCKISSIPILSRRCPTSSTCRGRKFISSTRSRWAKSTAPATSSTSHTPLSMSRICSTKSCWPATRRSGRRSSRASWGRRRACEVF